MTATVNQIRDYFGMTTKQLREEWAELSEDEKNFFRENVPTNVPPSDKEEGD